MPDLKRREFITLFEGAAAAWRSNGPRVSAMKVSNALNFRCSAIAALVRSP